MARMKGVSDAAASLIERGVFKRAKGRLGQVPEPLRIMAHSSGILWADVLFEFASDRARAVDSRLKSLASLKVASMIGCVF